jgi:hypothetical protein
MGILLPALIFLGREFFRARKEGLRTMNWKSIGKDSLWMIAAYAGLFGWAVIHTVYEDHRDLVRVISTLKTPPPELHAEIWSESIGVSVDRSDMLIVAGVLLRNDVGPARPLTNWNIQGKFGSQILDPLSWMLPDHDLRIPVHESDKSVMSLPRSGYCPTLTQDPIPSGATRSCWMLGIFKGKASTLKQANQNEVIVSFDDVLINKNRAITHSLPTGKESMVIFP